MAKKIINPIKSLKATKFFELIKERTERFNKSSNEPIPHEYQVNALARRLHPDKQFVKISKIVENSPDCKTYTLIPDTEKGTNELAYFSSGQYVTVFLEIEGLKITRPYSLSSAPYQSLGGEKGFYEITIKAAPDGLVSNYILENWKENQQIKISAPEGHFDYVYLRDAPTVVGIAGGSGITPFLSYAKSIVNGDENFNLILLYGSRDSSSILFQKELKELENKSNKIKVVHVLSGENTEVSNENEGSVPLQFEKGFINAELIKKYAPQSPYSIFLCGPQAMYNFVDKEIEKLDLEKKFVRHEMFGEIHNAKNQEGYPGCQSDEVTITVTICDQTYTVKGNANDTILQILEKGGIAVPNRCRSGECGWCHSLLKSGKVFIPARMDYRRKADIKFNFIHPCSTFALSDIELDIPPAK